MLTVKRPSASHLYQELFEKKELVALRQPDGQEAAKGDDGPPSTPSVTKPLFVTVIASIMGSLQLGYSIGVPSNTQDVLTHFLNETITEREGAVPSDDRLTNVRAIIVAIFFLGCWLGSMGNKWLSGRSSRRRGLLSNILLGVVASALLFASRRSRLWELLLVARVAIGTHCGFYSSQIPIYLSEISPKQIRGLISSLHVLGLVFGIFIAQVLGFPVLLGKDDRWDFLHAFTLVFCLVQLILLPFCVESPRFLMITKRDEEGARHALRKLRQSHEVNEEIVSMQEEISKAKEMVSLGQLFQHPPYRRAIVIVTISHVTLQLGGVNAAILYSNNVFQESAGLTQDEGAYATTGVGVLSILGVLIGTPLSDLAGRRTLQMLGLTGLVFSTVSTTICLTFRDAIDGLDIASIVVLLSFHIFFNLGPGLVPWIIVGEYFPQEAKPNAAAIAITVDWLLAFVVAYVFPPMERAMGDYVFLPFAVYSLAMLVYTYFQMPETKGKSIEEISAMFEHPGHSRYGT